MIHYVLFVTLFVLASSDTPSPYTGSIITEAQTGFVPSSAPYPSGISTHTAKNNQESQTYSQVLENASYDPNLYSNFVPHDAVQQYVSSYGGPQAYQTYNPDPSGFTVQNGYEGYLVPSVQHSQSLGESIGALGSSLGVGSSASGYGAGYSPYGQGYNQVSLATGLGSSLGSGFASRIGSTLGSGFGSDLSTGLGFPTLLSGLLPFSKTILAILIKMGSVILATIGVVFVGGFITLLICSFTTVCWFNFPALNWQRAVQDVSETISDELSSDRVKRATEFVKAALEKYQKLQETNVNLIDVVENKL